MSHGPSATPRLDPAALAAAERYFGVHADDLPIADVIDTVELWDPLESTCRHASLSIL